LTATTPSGVGAVTLDNIITVGDSPSTDFSFDVNDASVTFTNLSTDADSYSWDFGDGATSTDANPTHEYSASGFYTVILVATNSCGSTTMTSTVTVSFVSVASIDQRLQLNASPNPFSDQVNIQYDLPEGFDNAQLIIYDVLGQQVMTQALGNLNGNIIIDDFLMRGIYLVRIEADGVASQSLKLIKTE